jgi:hypothetical protein
MTRIAVNEIPSLLLPNATTTNEYHMMESAETSDNVDDTFDHHLNMSSKSHHKTSTKILIDPPRSKQEMYHRLVKLLHIRRTIQLKSSRRMLYLHRDLNLLSHCACKLNGHYVQLKAYESALGKRLSIIAAV